MNIESSTSGLMGLRVSVTLSDPWDFVTENGDDARVGTVLGIVNEYEALVRFDSPFSYKGLTTRHFKFMPRLAGRKIVDLLVPGTMISVNGTPISGATNDVQDMFDAARTWRGWGVIGSIAIHGDAVG